MDVEIQECGADEPDAVAMLDGFAAEVASLYTGWTVTSGPSASAGDFAPPAGAFVVAYKGSQPVGCGGLKRLDLQSAEVKRMFVAPEARGAGVGRRILVALEEIAQGRGYRLVRLDTGPSQPQALAIYRSAGYTPIEDYNGNPFATHWLEKELPHREVPTG